MKNILTQSLAKYYLSPRGLVSTINHNFDRGITSLSILNATRTTGKLIAHFFSPINALASKPVFTVTANCVVIHVFYYIPLVGKTLNNNTINNLGEALSKLFSFSSKNRTVELRLVKLHYPYLNSYILAQYIATNAKNYKLVKIVRRLFSFVAPVKNTQSINALASALPSHIVGLKVQVSGRLITERSRPRQTVQTAQIGSFSKSNLSLVDSACYTSKNKKGAFTVKVWISQRAIV